VYVAPCDRANLAVALCAAVELGYNCVVLRVCLVPTFAIASKLGRLPRIVALRRLALDCGYTLVGVGSCAVQW
jgi:hypothetical protein